MLRREESYTLPIQIFSLVAGRYTVEWHHVMAAAFTVGEQQLNGRIASGFRADLTAMATDPVDTPADDLVDVPIVLTLVDGEVVYRSDG